MKKLYLFCTNPLYYWVLLPLAVVLGVSIYYNDGASNLLKLYPLIVVSSGAIIFTLIYLFRLVEIRYDEIKNIGLFSGRDKAVITKGKTLSLLISPHSRIKVLLYGNDGKNAELDWMRGEPVRDTCQFRCKVIGGKGTIKRILGFFGADDSVIKSLIKEDSFTKRLENVTVSNEKTEEYLKINIKIELTI